MATLNAFWTQQTPTAAAGSLVSIRGGLILRGLARSQRQPVHIIFLVDRSGSMAGSRLQSVKRSLQFILQLMNENDLISVITYDDDANTILSRVSVSNDEKVRIGYAIEQIRDAGSTNMSAALLQARQVLGAPPADPAHPYKEGIVFLTDGHANRGVADKDGLLDIVQRTVNDFPGISISSVAYGEDHNVDLLSAMGRTGGGSYNLVNNLEAIATVFGDVLGGLSSVAAQNLVVHLPFEATPMTHYATKQADDLHHEIRIGDLYAQAELTVLFEAPPDTVQQIRVAYDDMTTLNHEDRLVSIQPLLAGEQPPKTLEIAVFRHEVSSILREMAKNPSSSALTALKTRAESTLTALKALPYVAENLIQMMIDDLENILESADRIEHGGYIGVEVTTAMAQHSAYLGMARGMRSMMPASSSAPPSPPLGAAPPSPPPGAAPPPAGTPPPMQRIGAQLHLNTTGSTPSAPRPLPRTRTARVDNDNSPFATPLQATASSAMRVLSQQNHP